MRLLVLTDRSLTGGRPLVDVAIAAVEGGADCIVLREKDLPREERAHLARDLRSVVPTLLVASDATIPSAGVHLAATDPPLLRSGRDHRLIGRSCHSPAELAVAAAEGCDYATLSPIFPSPSKPGYGPALGVAALLDAPLPVYALGGIDATNARSCIEAGAVGVAVMGCVMRAESPALAVSELLS